ncbi:MAG: hypothetical protein V3T86_12665 [Planctomycetota bacterium]
MAEIDLGERFPDMQPVSSPPGLGRLNGFGFGMYGKRDRDDETGTYISTLCFSALWIPLIALRSYRVADAEGGGWYFVGSVPLGQTAKLCNLLVLFASLIFGGRAWWNSHQADPEVRAANAMDDAAELLEENRIGEAAKIYRKVGVSGTLQALPARLAVVELVRKRIAGAPIDEAATVVTEAVALQKRYTSGVLKGIRGDVVAVAETVAASNPANALRLLDLVSNVGEPTEPEQALRRRLLEQLVESEPRRLEYRAALALFCEQADELDRCRELLEPFRDKLGDSEGARILGQLDARDGKLDAALALLAPYVTPRLERLRRAQLEYADVWEAKSRAALRKLQAGDGPRSFYTAHELADEEEQGRLVDEQIAKELEDDWVLEENLEEFRAASAVVPAALDLGIVHLRRGQQMVLDQRKEALLEAEKVFLATRAVSGHTNEYRLFLGQVYYWLGREQEGKALFDELLEANTRSSEIMMQVCSVLRELGAFHEACALAEEAYANEKSPIARQSIAFLRGLTGADADDQIAWLKKSDVDNPVVQAVLYSALGEKAQEKGDRAEAMRQFRAAIAAYAALPENAANHHNAALACTRLVGIEFDAAILDQAVDLFEKSLKMQPSSSLSMQALATACWTRAMAQIIGDRIDFRAARVGPSDSLLGFLYKTREGRDQLLARVHAHRDVRRALDLVGQARVVAPRNVGLIAYSAAYDTRLRNVDGLRRTLAALKRTPPDTGQHLEVALKSYTQEGAARSRVLANLAITFRRQALSELSSDVSAETRAVALVWLAAALGAGQMVGIEADPAEVTRLSEEAHQLVPSVTTENGLVQADLYAAHISLLRSEPAYRASAERLNGALFFRLQLAVALVRPGPAREAALKLPDLSRAAERIIAQTKAWPSGTDGEEWAVVQALHPDEARVMRGNYSERNALTAEINGRLYPFEPSRAAELYLHYMMKGDTKAAMDAIKACAKAGTPAPFLD